MSKESRVETALNASNVVSVPLTEAVTVTSSWMGASWSTKSSAAAAPASTVTTCRTAVRCSRCARTSYEPGSTPVDLKHPLCVGQCDGARANDEDHRAMDGVPGSFQRHGATHRAVLLRRHPG